MKDQNGNLVPDDLVLMPSIDILSLSGISTVDKAKWYEVNGWCLCVSAKEINYLSEDGLEDAGIEQIETVDYVDGVLHRYSLEDGFYHA